MTNHELQNWIADMEAEGKAADVKFQAIMERLMSKKRKQKGPTMHYIECVACKGQCFFGHVRCTACNGKGGVWIVSKPVNPSQGTL